MTWRMPRGCHNEPLDGMAFDCSRSNQTMMWHLFDPPMILWRLIDDMVVK